MPFFPLFSRGETLTLIDIASKSFLVLAWLPVAAGRHVRGGAQAVVFGDRVGARFGFPP